MPAYIVLMKALEKAMANPKDLPKKRIKPSKSLVGGC
jgi:hypothetical protein